MPPMKAPTIPMTMSVTTPEPPPRTSWEASQPAIRPTRSQMITISSVMTVTSAYPEPAAGRDATQETKRRLTFTFHQCHSHWPTTSCAGAHRDVKLHPSRHDHLTDRACLRDLLVSVDATQSALLR